jgi:hypothetical protein
MGATDEGQDLRDRGQVRNQARRLNVEGGVMSKLRRPAGRPFCLLLAIVFAAAALHSSTPTMTRVLDTVYRADGLPAAGVLLISWPAFTTAEAVSNRDIVDEGKFKEGLSKIIDGTVECLNSSTWAKAKAQ